MLKNSLKGFSAIQQAASLMMQPSLRRFILMPLLINCVLLGIAVYFLFSQFGIWLDYLMPDFPSWLSWLETAISWLLWPLFSALIFFLLFNSFSFLMNLIASPFNSLLAQKTAALINGQAIDTDSALPPLNSIIKALKAEAQKLMYLIKWALLLFIISFIPIINIAAPFLWFIFGAWMLAITYLDYPMGNRELFFSDIQKYAKKNKSSTLSMGTGLFILTNIPLINFIAMPVGVIAATLTYTQQEK